MGNWAGKGKIRISTVGKMNEKGFTLIEMAVVVLLTGVLVGIAVPRVKDTIAGDRLKKTTRQIIAVSRDLRNDSVREQVDYELYFDIDNGAFWKCSSDMTSEKRAEVKRRALKLPDGVGFRDIRIYGAAKKTHGEAVVRFFKQGYMQPAVVHLMDGDKNMTLIFNPFITRVKIQDDYVDVWQKTSE